MALYPTPHSAEWFAALDVFNPVQAVHTRQIMKSAGRAGVCSVCGDDPPKDFKIVVPNLPVNAVASIRLCDYCRRMRSSMNAEV